MVLKYNKINNNSQNMEVIKKLHMLDWDITQINHTLPKMVI
jgi:hypothetical protein